MDTRYEDQDTHHHEKKQSYVHVMRARLYGVIAINTIEGINNELDNLLPSTLEKNNIYPLSDQYRKYRNGVLYPTSYGDHMDRAVKSLGKDLGIAVSVDLANTQAVKKVLSKCIRSTSLEERKEVADWLASSNDMIMKSDRFEQLIDRCCTIFYNKHAKDISEDNLSFIRRSANELLRNKASKEAMRKRLLSSDHFEDDADDPVSRSYALQSSGNDSRMFMMDSTPVTNPNAVTIPGIGEMTSMNPLINLTSINHMPITSYDAIPISHMNQIGNTPHSILSSREVDSQSSGMNMSMPIAMNSITTMGLSPVSVNAVNSMPVTMGMIPMNGMGVVDGQRSYGGMNQNVEMTIARPVNEETDERRTTS